MSTHDVVTPGTDHVMSGSVAREHGGVYTCTAENGVGGPAEANISLTVLHGPVISLGQETIRRGRDRLRLELECRVEAEPRPEVRWYKDTMLLDPSHTHQMGTREGNR